MHKGSKVTQIPEVEQREERLYKDRRFKPSRTEAGVGLCRRCGAVGIEKLWYFDKQKYMQAESDPTSRLCLCPGCKRVEDGYVEGQVELSSPLISENLEMVFGLIGHTQTKAFLYNPLARIVSMERDGDTIRIKTTTRWLAMRLGKEFDKAFKGGKLEIHPPAGSEFVTVKWHRTEKPQKRAHVS